LVNRLAGLLCELVAPTDFFRPRTCLMVGDDLEAE